MKADLSLTELRKSMPNVEFASDHSRIYDDFVCSLVWCGDDMTVRHPREYSGQEAVKLVCSQHFGADTNGNHFLYSYILDDEGIPVGLGIWKYDANGSQIAYVACPCLFSELYTHYNSYSIRLDGGDLLLLAAMPEELVIYRIKL